MKKYIFILLLQLAGLAVTAQLKTDSVSTTAKDSTPKSFAEISLTYQNQALEAGRTFNVSQFSIVPSISYTHKSGVFASVTGNWLSENNPNYMLTVLCAGYSTKAGKSFDISGSIARNIFSTDTAGLIANVFTAATTYNRKWFTAGISYSYLSGIETGHLMNLSSSGYWENKCRKLIDVVSVNPGISILAGTATVPFTTFGKSTFEQGNRIPWLQRRWQTNTRTTTQPATSYEFGLMNLDFSLPVSVYKGGFAFTASANYSIPFKLAEEEGTTISKQFYVTAGILYTIQ